MWYVRPADQPAYTHSLIRAFASSLNILTVKLLTKHHLEILSLKGGCTACLSQPLKKCHNVGNHIEAQLFKLYRGHASLFKRGMCIKRLFWPPL